MRRNISTPLARNYTRHGALSQCVLSPTSRGPHPLRSSLTPLGRPDESPTLTRLPLFTSTSCLLPSGARTVARKSVSRIYAVLGKCFMLCSLTVTQKSLFNL